MSYLLGKRALYISDNVYFFILIFKIIIGLD